MKKWCVLCVFPVTRGSKHAFFNTCGTFNDKKEADELCEKFTDEHRRTGYKGTSYYTVEYRDPTTRSGAYG